MSCVAQYPMVSYHMRHAFRIGGQSLISALWSLHNSQMEHCMQFPVLYLSPDLGTNNIDLPLRVSKVASKECIGESFETLGDLQVIPGANFLLFTVSLVSSRNHTCTGEPYQMFVSRPGSHWQYELLSFDIFKASILHPSFKKRAGARLNLGSSRRVEEHLVENGSGGIRLQRAVRRRPC